MKIPQISCPVCPRGRLQTYIDGISDYLVAWDKYEKATYGLQEAMGCFARRMGVPLGPVEEPFPAIHYLSMIRSAFFRAASLLEDEFSLSETTAVSKDRKTEFKRWTAVLEACGHYLLDPQRLQNEIDGQLSGYRPSEDNPFHAAFIIDCRKHPMLSQWSESGQLLRMVFKPDYMKTEFEFHDETLRL